MDWITALSADNEHHLKLTTDLEYFAGEHLKIRPKAGRSTLLHFNPAQRRLHEIIEEQRASTGMVRIVVLKGRQMGISTYIAARFFHKTINSPGHRTLIIAHEKPASGTLFKMVKRFSENMPEDARPSVGTSNAQELIFDKIDSGYGVSVATEEGAGRSDTAQALHASEAARWVDWDEQIAALMQTVPEMPDTEIVIETTARGYNDFKKFWDKASKGLNSFKAVFLPWTLDPQYSVTLPEGFTMTADETTLAEMHGLDAGQVAWRRRKIADMGSEELFQQEYPLTASEAFIQSNVNAFIPSELVMKARKTSDIQPSGDLIVGVDPAGASSGADSTALAWRRGRVIEKTERHHGLDTMQIAGLVAKIIREEKPAKVNIDIGGLGVGVYDRLIEQGYGNFGKGIVNGVHFGGKPIEPPPLDEHGKPAGGPLNRRSEMWLNVKNALQEGRLAIPDSETLQGDLTGPTYKYNSDSKLVLESKEDMRKRGVDSPDEGDAVALCFSEPDGAPMVANSNFNRPIVYPHGAVA